MSTERCAARARCPVWLALACGWTSAAQGGIVYWTDWQSATLGAPGSAAGTITTPIATIGITYAGELTGAQTSVGADYWDDTDPNLYGTSWGENSDPYRSATVSNRPPAPDILFLPGTGGITETITFDQPVTGVVMSFYHFAEYGSNMIAQFDRPIGILSKGGYFTGFLGDFLVSEGGSCTIEIPGTFSSFTWTHFDPGGHTYGFTVGVLPAPGTATVLGCVGVMLTCRRRRAVGA